MSPEENAFFELVETLLAESPSEWRADLYDMTHAKSGISVWHDASHVSVDGARVHLSWLWKRRLRRAVNKCLALKAVERLKSPSLRVAA